MVSVLIDISEQPQYGSRNLVTDSDESTNNSYFIFMNENVKKINVFMSQTFPI